MSRLQGRVERKLESYGFIRDERGVCRFFIPSGIESPEHVFDDFVEGTRVDLIPIEGHKGPRADKIRMVAAPGEE
jgi:cold shock CspA family protein